MKENWYRIAKLIIAVLALFLFYLYIQNGRYVVSKPFVVDKWTGEVEVLSIPNSMKVDYI